MVKIHGALKIGVLCGGMSSEREVSLRSGKNCYEALLRLGYENATLIDVDRNIVKNLTEKGIELAFIAMHGKYGEDGCIQGLLEILGIPYTGCGVKASAVCMDKEFTKRIVVSLGVPVIPTLVYDENTDYEYPVMVKPVSEGSSIGMSKANNKHELSNAVKDAEKYGTGVMIEKFLEGQSITVGVLDMDGKTIATPILELRVKNGWYDYEAKYTKGLTEFILPAELSEQLTKEIQELSIKAHKAVEARGMSRVDFIVSRGKPYMLEINTIPGMTDLSDLPAQAKAMGIEYDQLVEIILKSALS